MLLKYRQFTFLNLNKFGGYCHQQEMTLSFPLLHSNIFLLTTISSDGIGTLNLALNFGDKNSFMMISSMMEIIEITRAATLVSSITLNISTYVCITKIYFTMYLERTPKCWNWTTVSIMIHCAENGRFIFCSEFHMIWSNLH